MTTRSCSAWATSPAASQTRAVKVRRRPSTAVSVQSHRTVMPTGVGAVCASASRVPTVPLPGSSSGATACQQAFSISAATAGVASTGSSPLPSARAVSAVVTQSSACPQMPGCNMVTGPLSS